MEIKRSYYIEQLKRKEKNGLIKVITGLRRVGKSYLLFNLFKSYLLEEKRIPKSHIISLALDDLENEKYRNPYELISHIKGQIKDNKTYYILLDEIQYVERFPEVLTSLMHYPTLDIYVTGSNSKFLSNDIITEFRGRGDEIHVYPLRFIELCEAYQDYDKAWDDYYNYGGMPFVLSCTTNIEKIKYLTSLFENVYISDILERHKINNQIELDELLDILSSGVGSLTNPLKLSKIFKGEKNKKISDKTINRYLNYFEDSFLINKVKRYDVKGKKYINSPCKYYFEDVGLRNARINFRQPEENHIMENIIYNELKARGYQVDVGIVGVYEYNKNKKRMLKNYEVDFIVNNGNNKVYIQSAFSVEDEKKLKQECNSLNNINDSFQKIIIVRNKIEPRITENGIQIISIYDFLLEKSKI